MCSLLSVQPLVSAVSHRPSHSSAAGGLHLNLARRVRAAPQMSRLRQISGARLTKRPLRTQRASRSGATRVPTAESCEMEIAEECCRTRCICFPTRSCSESSTPFPTHPNTRILHISSQAFFEDSYRLSLAVRMAHLRELTIWDVKFVRVHLNAQLTPCLTSFSMQNVSDCDLQVVVPTLEKVLINHHNNEEFGSEWVVRMLENAPALRSFNSYKLWVPRIAFASNALEEIRIHRSDCMSSVRIYAPNLKRLHLGACYDLEEVIIDDQHPTLSALLPANHRPSKFNLSSENSIFSASAQAYLKRHPRVKLDGPLGGEDDGGF